MYVYKFQYFGVPNTRSEYAYARTSVIELLSSVHIFNLSRLFRILSQ